MAKMVEPVQTLQQRILTLLNEWDEHPALRKILDVIEMVLAIPLNTPLAKVIDLPNHLTENNFLIGIHFFILIISTPRVSIG